MKKIACWLLLIQCVCGFSVHSAEKVGTTSMQFLKIAPDSRAAAMGEAFVSVADNSFAVFSNPAGLVKTPGLDMSASYIDYFIDTKLSAVALSFSFQRFGTIAIHGVINDYGTFEETKVENLGFNEDYTFYNPGLTGKTFTSNAIALGLSYAKMLTDKFSFGLTARFVSEDLYVKKVSTVVFDGGFTYQTGLRSIEIGGAIRNFGSEIQYYDKPYPLPQEFHVGISSNLIDAENSLVILSPGQKLLIAAEMMHARDYDKQFNLGMEYSIQNMISLRGGYKLNRDEEGLTLGVGLNMKGIRFDYAYDQYGDILSSVHKFTFGYGIQ